MVFGPASQEMLGFYSKWEEEPLEEFEMGNNMI